MANIVGEGFDPVIINQINRRQLIYGSANKSNEELSYLNARTGWCKMVSSVDVARSGVRNIPTTGVELARDFVLFNGTSNQIKDGNLLQRRGIWDGNTTSVDGANVRNPQDYWAYGIGGTEFGINPMPGIISAEIKTETRGSLKTATVKIKANNRDQFDIIDILYLRLGFTMLLEWGNSSYFSNDGTYVTDNSGLANDFLKGTMNYSNAFSKITNERIKTCGNYDAIVGKVVNFQWSFLKDGTYDITVILRSMGDVIESLKTNSLLPGGTIEEAESTTGNSGTSGTAGTAGTSSGPPPEPTPEDVIKDFANTHEIGKWFNSRMEMLKSKTASANGMSVLTAGDGTISFLKQEYQDGGNTQYYVRLGSFLKFIEKTLIPHVVTPEVKLLGIDTDVDSNLIYLVGRQLSTDPGVVIFKKRFTTPSGFIDFCSEGAEFAVEYNKNSYGKIMNAYFNLSYILTQLDSLKNEDGKVPLYDLINCLCQGWNRATGNFNKLEPTVDTERNKIVILDEVVCPDRESILKAQGKSTELAVFDIYGYYYNKDGTSKAGFVRDLSFTTTVSPNLASMITIGATSKGYVVGQDATALSQMNSGLTDRFKKTITLGDTNQQPSSGSLLKDYAESIDAFNVFLQDLGSWKGTNVPKWNQEAITSFTNAAVTFYEYDQAKQTEQNKATNPNASSPNAGFLPFDLQLTLDGLSGMKIYQKYTIFSSFLPSNYPTSLEFLIKGITNTISNNEWITTLESIAIPLSTVGTSIGTSPVQTASSNNRDASRGTAPLPGNQFEVTPTYRTKDKRNIITNYGWPILVSNPDGTTYYGSVSSTDSAGRNVYVRDEQYIKNNVVSFKYTSTKDPKVTLSFKFHKALVEPLKTVLTQIDNEGLISYAKNIQATIYTRDTTGSPGNLSGHAFGVAMDVNPDKFPYGQGGYDSYIKAINDKKNKNYNYARVNQIIAQSGLFSWGGNYGGTKDAHHFSVDPYNI